MMPGMIMLWYGAVVDIPTGWTLCDGNNGSPNLTNQFVLGAGGVFPPDASGGSSAHDHTFTGDGHSHDLQTGNQIESVTPDGDFKHNTYSSPATGTTGAGAHMPPYYALCYIMKTPVP